MKYGPSLERRTDRHQGTKGRLHGASPLLFRMREKGASSSVRAPRLCRGRHPC